MLLPAVARRSMHGRGAPGNGGGPDLRSVARVECNETREPCGGFAPAWPRRALVPDFAFAQSGYAATRRYSGLKFIATPLMQ